MRPNNYLPAEKTRINDPCCPPPVQEKGYLAIREVHPPNRTSTMNTITFYCTAGAIVLFLLITHLLPAPGNNHLINVVQNFGHTPVYGILSLLFFHMMGRFTFIKNRSVGYHYIASGVVATATGMVMELLQIPLERDASVLDIINDCIGIFAFLGLHAAVDPLLRIARKKLFQYGVLCLSALLLLVSLYPVIIATGAYLGRNSRFPILHKFESRGETSFLDFRHVSTEIRIPSEDWPQNASNALRVVFHSGTQYPGISLSECFSDWQKYSSLCFSVFLPESTGATLSLRIHDSDHNNEYTDRYNTKLAIKGGLNEISIPLSDVARAPKGRKMDMAHIRTITLFCTSLSEDLVVWFDDFRLELVEKK